MCFRRRNAKEDTRKDEVFYNEVIARDEIDTLLSPKVFTNTKKYDADGEHTTEVLEDEDSLVIKGNNLLALYSLKERYSGKVKLIYIDPPYNTGSDSFKYNDRFSHSTWLTFMKNRLEIAKSLLTTDGSIFINIDDDESHYLKVLADEIFGRENFIANIVWQKKYTISNDAKWFSDNHDHILVYAKVKDNFHINKLERSEEMNKRYQNQDNDPRGPWMTAPLHAKSGRDTNFSYRFQNGVLWTPPRGTYPRYSKESLKKFENENRIWFGKDGTAVPRIKKYLSDMGKVTPETIWLYKDFGNNDQANKELKNIIKDEEFSTPKPEKLLEKILEIGSCKNDLILDFFMGSATTQAVSMKMHRRFIGIEQMDYINSVSVPRLKKVIAGEDGGISKDVGWQGGGSFVYTELMELNQKYIKLINQASTTEELLDLWTELDNNADLNFQLDREKLVRELLNEWDENLDIVNFKSLSLKEQKLVFMKSLDLNQLYVSYSEIDDENIDISCENKKFNRSFYNSGREM